MKKLIPAALSLILCLSFSKTFSQDTTYSGTEFWVAYGHHQYMETDNTQDMTLYISVGSVAATVTITIDSSSVISSPSSW